MSLAGTTSECEAINHLACAAIISITTLILHPSNISILLLYYYYYYYIIIISNIIITSNIITRLILHPVAWELEYSRRLPLGVS